MYLLTQSLHSKIEITLAPSLVFLQLLGQMSYYFLYIISQTRTLSNSRNEKANDTVYYK